MHEPHRLLGRALATGFVYQGEPSAHRDGARRGQPSDHLPPTAFVDFLQNHDQIGNRAFGERIADLAPRAAVRAAQAVLLLAPNVPLLFMGEEYDETNPFLYFVSHSDETLIENVRQGRKKEFAAFHTDDVEVPDPQSEKTFQQSKLQWHLVNEDHHRTMFAYYKALLTLRKNHPALQHLNRKQLEVLYDEESKTLQLHRWHYEEHIICLMNFSQTAQLITLTLNQSWVKIMDSAEERWGGNTSMPDTLQDKMTLMLRPESFVMYSAAYV